MLMSQKKKVDFRVQVPPDIADRADALFDDVGPSRSESVTRILRWLLAPTGRSDLDDTIQRQILGVLSPPIQVDVARAVLKRMANELDADEARRIRIAAEAHERETEPKRGGKKQRRA